MNFLIVDDSKAMRMIVARALRQAGYTDAEFVEASSGREAWDLIRSDPPDLVLCDWNMPEMTGLELLRELRSTGSPIRFGFVTSEKTLPIRHAALDAGADFLVVKPFTADSLRSAIASVL